MSPLRHPRSSVQRDKEARAARAERLRDQVAALKVLRESALDHLRVGHETITAWTRNVLVYEAEVTSFDFRIEEFEAELKRIER